MLRQGAIEYMTKNQVQIVYVIKCNEFSQVTLATHLPHPYHNMDVILFMFSKTKRH